MKIKRGDYTFCGDDTRPHRWAVKVGKGNTLVQLTRMTYCEFQASIPEGLEVFGVPDKYYVANDGLFATFYPRADKEYELVQLSDREAP